MHIDLSRHDPVLLKKILRIYKQADAVSMLAVKSGADLTPKESRPIKSRPPEEEPQILALMNEFNRDAVLAALGDVVQIRVECFFGGPSECFFGGPSEMTISWPGGGSAADDETHRA